ncbi:MAG TPA: acyltransferase, partial [Gemmatimonadales bacterium]
MNFRELLQPPMRAPARPGRDAGGYRPDIDGLRAIAVLSVLFYHVGFASFAGGWVGVDVFFVISGFLITRLIKLQVEAGTFRFGTFYLRRARRLLPALLVTSALSAIAATTLLSPRLLQEFGGSVVFTSLSLANWFFFRQSNYFDTSAISKPLLHTWSLGVEEQFYLVWPAFIVVALAIWPKRRTPWLILCAGAVSLAAATWFNAHRSAVFYLTPFRAFEFAIGGLVVWLPKRKAPSNVWMETGLATGLALIVAAVAGLGTGSYSGLAVVTPCIGAGLVIHCGTARVGGALLRNPLAVGIGLISYSLYLVHWPIVVFLHYQRHEDFSVSG